MSHTPGPWEVHGSADGRNSVRVCIPCATVIGCRSIAEAEIIRVERLEAEANARLIAAAPELVAELSTICVEWEDATKRLARDFDNTSYEELLPKQYHRAKALIAKATGGVQ